MDANSTKSPQQIWADFQTMLNKYETQEKLAAKIFDNQGNLSKYLTKLTRLVKLYNHEKPGSAARLVKELNQDAITKKFYDTLENELNAIKSEPSFIPPIFPEDLVNEPNQGYTNALSVAQEDHIHTLKENNAFIKASHTRQEEMLREQIVAQREQIAAQREQIAAYRDLSVANKEMVLLIKQHTPQEKKSPEPGAGGEEKQDGAGEKKARGERKGHEEAGKKATERKSSGKGKSNTKKQNEEPGDDHEGTGKIATEKKRHPEEGDGSNAEASDLP